MLGKNRQVFERRRHSKRIKVLRRCYDCGTLMLWGRQPHQRHLICGGCERANRKAERLLGPYLPLLKQAFNEGSHRCA